MKIVPNVSQKDGTPIDFAMLSGTWYEMGYQFGIQHANSIAKATAIALANAVMRWGSREKVDSICKPYFDCADTVFRHEKDGSLADMIRGCAAGCGLSLEDMIVYFLEAVIKTDIPAGVPYGEEKEYRARTQEEDVHCSVSGYFGTAAANGKKGAVLANNVDAGFMYLDFAPVLILKPNNGYIFTSAMGLFGGVCNSAGFSAMSASGQWNLKPNHDRVGLNPHGFLGAYCGSVEEALKVLGDPEKGENVWPIGRDVTMILGDSTGDVAIYELTAVKRAVRRNGDPKYLGRCDKCDVRLADETGDYIVGNNFFCTEKMWDGAGTVKGGPKAWRIDTTPRYWSVEKYIQDAIANGGATVDTLREAQGSHKYYIPEGWDFDAFPDMGYIGFWVPSDIYEKLSSGELDRDDYYGKVYDLEKWGKPMSLEESRSIVEWSPGWHDNFSNWTLNLKINVNKFAPEPVMANHKTITHLVYDTNTCTEYIMRGSSDRGLATITGHTATYAVLNLDVKAKAAKCNGDEYYAMLLDAEENLKRLIWLANKNFHENKLDITKADNAIIYQYHEMARDFLFQGMNYRCIGAISDDLTEKMSYYGKAMTAYARGQCYAQLAQEDPWPLLKDYGIKELHRK